MTLITRREDLGQGRDVERPRVLTGPARAGMTTSKHSAERPEQVLRMAMDRLGEHPDPPEYAKAFGPEPGVGAPRLHRLPRQAPIDGEEWSDATPEALEEIRRLKAEVRNLREANEILKAATALFVRELDQVGR